jgi:hypothetical protein
MDLTLSEGYRIKFCMKLIAVIYHDKYYSRFTIYITVNGKCINVPLITNKQQNQ